MTEGIAHLSPVWARYSTVVAERAEGAYIYDVDGNRYLDFTCGIGVANTGHCHPKVVEAAREQAGKFIHAQANIVYHQPMIRLVEELLTVVPENLGALFFSNSGAEAVEASFKLARQATGRTNLIVFQGGFHGRTVGTMSLTTSKTIYRVRYQPLMAGVFVAPYAYCYTCPLGDWTEREGLVPAFPGGENCGLWCLKQVRHLLVTQTAPEETAAMIVEPVLGEGGYVVPPPEFIRGLREICDEHGILLVIDEVQSGFGRTGKFFAIEHFGVAPDIMIMAKGLASGFPLSGIAARRELMDKWIVGSHGGTYGGNAVSCAAAAATIQVIKEEGLTENSARMGEFLRERLRELQEPYPVIGDVRGLGLMVATEFTTPDGEPDKATTKAVQASCLENKLMLLTCGSYDNVIRWIPPLIVTEEQIEEALEIFERAVQGAVAA
jgi:4-aminobutyrate aminotransferase